MLWIVYAVFQPMFLFFYSVYNIYFVLAIYVHKWYLKYLNVFGIMPYSGICKQIWFCRNDQPVFVVVAEKTTTTKKTVENTEYRMLYLLWVHAVFTYRLWPCILLCVHSITNMFLRWLPKMLTKEQQKNTIYKRKTNLIYAILLQKTSIPISYHSVSYSNWLRKWLPCWLYC